MLWGFDLLAVASYTYAFYVQFGVNLLHAAPYHLPISMKVAQLPSSLLTPGPEREAFKTSSVLVSNSLFYYRILIANCILILSVFAVSCNTGVAFLRLTSQQYKTRSKHLWHQINLRTRIAMVHIQLLVFSAVAEICTSYTCRGPWKCTAISIYNLHVYACFGLLSSHMISCLCFMSVFFRCSRR